jgi:tRNA G18 (ribose-2'-O)-methylase SpoU
MSSRSSAGEQLDNQSLHERQKKFRAENNFLPAPIIIAAGLQVPENLGSVLRLADAAGSQQVIFVSDDDIARSLKQIQRTARNADALIHWEVWAQEKFLQCADSLEPLIAVEVTTASSSIFENELPEKGALIIGNEQHGIPASILAKCQRAIHIPMFGVNGSMNVTHALAIALFEWRRQHSKS